MARQKSKEVVAAEKAIKENYTPEQFEAACPNDIRLMLNTKKIKISNDKLYKTIQRLEKELESGHVDFSEWKSLIPKPVHTFNMKGGAPPVVQNVQLTLLDELKALMQRYGETEVQDHLQMVIYIRS